MKNKQNPDWDHFVDLCLKTQNKNDLKQLLDLFMTIEEKETLATRYTIIKSLLQGKLTQREIAEKSRVSIAKITRGSNALKIISNHLKSLLEKKMGV